MNQNYRGKGVRKEEKVERRKQHRLKQKDRQATEEGQQLYVHFNNNRKTHTLMIQKSTEINIISQSRYVVKPKLQEPVVKKSSTVEPRLSEPLENGGGSLN